jgi:hypothetical protein
VDLVEKGNSMSKNLDEMEQEYRLGGSRREKVGEFAETVWALFKIGCTMAGSLAFCVFMLWVGIQILKWMGAL